MSSKKPQNEQRKSLLAGVSIFAAAAAAMSGSAAMAQDAAGDEEDTIVVTGSRIPQPNLQGTSPVTQVTAEDITTQGVTRVEDLTNQLPQVFAAQGSNVSNGASGTAQVNLRGLGATRSLVLIDGRRMPYGSPNSTPADLNQIPGPLVERVELLTGGASAVYGSEAVAGVVNFIMRDDFEGFRVDAQYGFYQHSNDSDNGFIREELAFRNTLNPAQFTVPEDNIEHGYGKELALIFGASSPDGKGNVTAYATYRSNDAVLQRDYDYSACALGGPSTVARPGVPTGAQHWTCGGSGTSFPGRFTDFATFNFSLDNAGNFIPFNGNLHNYNFGPLNFYQRPDERYALGAFAHYEINDRAEAYAQLMMSDYRSVSQIAPSGDFFSTGTINCGNTMLSAAQAAAIGCSPAEIAADAITSLYIGRRNVEGGGRQDDLNLQSYRAVVGVRGALTDTWNYDVYGQFARVSLARSYLNDFSVTRLNRALDVVDDPSVAGIQQVCRSVLNGSDPNCVPYNVFTPGGVTPAALSYLQIPLIQRGETVQQNVVASISGELDINLMAETKPSLVLGMEYRRDEINQVVDENFATGNASGQGGPTLPLSGVSDAMELFMEARIPIIEGAPLADQVSIDLAYRYSDYATGINTDTYKIGADYAPVEDLRFRASFQRAIRAANIIELFSSQGVGLFDMAYDPCDAVNRPVLDGPVPAICIGGAPYQVTAAQSASGGLDSPAGQYTGLFGGNPDLSPEDADTTTFGLVFTPSFIPGLTGSIDYFKIEVGNVIGISGATNTLARCFEEGNLAECARISRNPGTGQLWIGSGQVEDLNTNLTGGGLNASGYDINVAYEVDVGSMGSLNFALIGTLLDELSSDGFDCKGFYGAGTCGTPNPEWRHRVRVGWESPFDVTLYATWRHYGEVERLNAAPVAGQTRLDRVFDAENYLDLAGNWTAKDNLRFRFGVNNVLDNDPPISDNVGAGFGNGNTYPQVYDSLGRWVFAGVTMDF
jgi:iron complex outermembrane recepter protein